ncbi:MULTISPECIES: hypothetical protein [unclassified Sinorhizobium]|uniref:hypothetical protein n=1 Tax=unclassified Sinorhizobium TaxID=2613772 RepID=UPI00352321AC
MTKTRNDLTLDEVLRDPLIALIRSADGVGIDEFKNLLETAARNHKAERSKAEEMLARLTPQGAHSLPLYACLG